MDHVEIINALISGDCLHIRDQAEAKRTGRPAEAILAAGGRVSMAHAMRAARSPLVCVAPQVAPQFAPKTWTPDGVCYVIATEN